MQTRSEGLKSRLASYKSFKDIMLNQPNNRPTDRPNNQPTNGYKTVSIQHSIQDLTAIEKGLEDMTMHGFRVVTVAWDRAM